LRNGGKGRVLGGNGGRGGDLGLPPLKKVWRDKNSGKHLELQKKLVIETFDRREKG